MHVKKVEEGRSQEEYEAVMAESDASRAEKVKEVEELKDTKSPPRHPLALPARTSHRCNCCRQILCLTELCYFEAREKPTKGAAASRR